MSKSILDLDAASQEFVINKLVDGEITEKNDWIAREEPLEIKILHGPSENRVLFTLAITMRTPGDDYDLARGFLLTEVIIQNCDEIIGITYDLDLAPEKQQLNSLIVELSSDLEISEEKLNRHFYTTSSCGVCGKTSLEMVRLQSSFFPPEDSIKISKDQIQALFHLLKKEQQTFEQTGGLHAAALVDLEGNLILSREDIGRHNAVDKLIGAFCMDKKMPLRQHIMLVSGRAGFELVQKSVIAGLPIFVAMGAASSLAIELAEANNMTLIGFLQEGSFNIYSHPERITQ